MDRLGFNFIKITNWANMSEAKPFWFYGKAGKIYFVLGVINDGLIDTTHYRVWNGRRPEGSGMSKDEWTVPKRAAEPV